MKVSVLTNDLSIKGFDSEHGLSLYINMPKYNILFDTGMTSIYLENAKRLGVDILNVDYIVLSHGHYDHMGGLVYFPKDNNVKEVVLHKDVFLEKFARDPKIRFNGVPYKKSDLDFFKLQEFESFFEVDSNFYVISDIIHPMNQNKYYVGETLDDFHDELILVLEENNELTLFMGCSHYGVKYGIERVKKEFPNRRIKNIFAGMHLINASNEEIANLGEYLNTLNFDLLVPLHCTGERAMKHFKKLYLDKCLLLQAGDEIKC